MSEVEVVRRVRLFGAADTVVEIQDGWEGMDLGAIHFGSVEDHKIEFGGDQAAFDWPMARAIAKELNRLADEHDPIDQPSPLLASDPTA